MVHFASPTPTRTSKATSSDSVPMPHIIQMGNVIDSTNEPETMGSSPLSTCEQAEHAAAPQQSSSSSAVTQENATDIRRPQNAVTPQQKSFWEIPELADRYVPVISTVDDVVYKDPRKFSVKPPFWEKWQPREYSTVAEYLEAVDLIPLSRALNKSVEEVQYMISAVVTRPLADAREARRRGESGIEAVFETFRQHGTPQRKWGREDSVAGEMDKISPKTVHLILPDGTKGEIKTKHLSTKDRDWIKKNVPKGDRDTLYGSDGSDNEDEDDPNPEQKMTPPCSVTPIASAGEVAMTVSARLDTGKDNEEPDPRVTVRPWTAGKVIGRYGYAQPNKIAIVTETSGTFSVMLDELTAEDKLWLNHNLGKREINTIKGTSALQDQVSSSSALNEKLKAAAKTRTNGSTPRLPPGQSVSTTPTVAATLNASTSTPSPIKEPHPANSTFKKRPISESDTNKPKESPSKRSKVLEPNKTMLLKNAPGPDGVRHWTDDGSRASFQRIERNQLHLNREYPPGSTLILQVTDMNKEDVQWLKANVKKQWIKVFAKGCDPPGMRRRDEEDEDEEYRE